MRQYCRYCAHFVTGNGNYCERRRFEPSDEYAKRANNCKQFDFCEIDAFGIEHRYTPRTTTKRKKEQLDNMSLWDGEK